MSDSTQSWNCDDCGRVLAGPISFSSHQRIHSMEKPYKCPSCPKDFIQRYDLKQHIKVAHQHKKDKSTEE